MAHWAEHARHPERPGRLRRRTATPARHHVPSPAGSEHGTRRRRQHRHGPAHGLHRSRGHDQCTDERRRSAGPDRALGSVRPPPQGTSACEPSIRSKPIRTPSEVVTSACGIRRVFTYSGSVPTATCGRNVTGPGCISCSTGVSGATSALSNAMRPSTTRWSLTTTQTSQRPARTWSRTAPTRSSIRQVGTLRNAMSATRDVCASRPSRGSPAANQSAFPGWYR